MAEGVGLPSDLVRRLSARIGDRGIIGVGGPVAVGKSTIADALVRELDDARVIPTDAFLLPNDELAARGLAHRKGFPETYDTDALVRTLEQARDGAWPLEIPVYSHDIYDIVAGARDRVEEAGVLIVDGVMAIQPPVVDVLDVGIYVHAEEVHVRRWFVQRFLALVDAADEGSFYRGFADMAPEQVRPLAEGTWDAINGPNLHEHIGPSMASATFVVRKGPSHEVLGFDERS